MADEADPCPCSAPPHPREIDNPPGLERLAARIGDYQSFRAALLRPLAGETSLRHWQPTRRGDLALQLLEWWAYIADVLAFYDERVAHASYLRSAELPEQVARLVRILGYRPRPAIAASGVLAALASSTSPLTAAQGLPLQNKPGPGESPQWFEVDAATTIEPSGVVEVDVWSNAAPSGNSIVLAGRVNVLQPGQALLLVHRDWSPTSPAGRFAVAVIASVSAEKGLRGESRTRIAFSSAPSLSGAPANEFHAERPERVTQLYTQASKAKILEGSSATTALHLAGLSRELHVGARLIVRYGNQARLVRITSYGEVVWYANADSLDAPQTSPDPSSKIPLAVPHSRIEISPSLTGLPNPDQIVIELALRPLGELLPEALVPAANLSSLSLVPRTTPPPLLAAGRKLIVEDANRRGAAAVVQNVSASSIQLTFDPPLATALQPPLRLLYNLLPVSRGQSVTREVLGSGDSARAGQSFTLRKSPLTYLPGSAPGFDDGYHSTLRVWVDGIEWTEVPTFYGRTPNARVFVTREDELNRTTVQFGDGLLGARLPSGTDNVVASYRFGGGAAAPSLGSLSVLLRPLPGLQSVRQPLALAGGADPDPADKIRRYAPRSVLAFGRAVSVDDYETIAGQAPGVVRARAIYAWNGAEQRASVEVYVGGDAAAVTSARKALEAAVDPTRQVTVKAAQAKSIGLQLSVSIEPGIEDGAVREAIVATLLDPDEGVCGVLVHGIGNPIYRSRIFELCHRVAGVRAVSALAVTGASFGANQRLEPGSSGFFVLAADALQLATEAANDGS